MCDVSMFTIPDGYFLAPMIMIALFLTFEWWKREEECALFIDDVPVFWRRATYLLVFGVTVWFYSNDNMQFIYFQF